MKRILLSIAITTLGFTANAQKVKFGVKAGLNIAEQRVSVQGVSVQGISTIDNNIENQSIFGFHVGAMAEIKLGEKFAIQPELLYSTKGSKEVNSETTYFGITISPSSEEMNLGYISLPITAKYFIIENLSLEIGPQLGFLVSAKRSFERTIIQTTVNTGPEGIEGTTDVESFNEKGSEEIDGKLLNGFDFGLNFGAGYTLPMGLNFQARYNLGLSSINKVFAESIKVKNSVIQVSVGYFF